MKTRDYRLASAQRTISDAEAVEALRTGVKDPAGKPLMVPFTDRLSDTEIIALVAYLRTLQKN